jgi:hypothetical protein
MKLEKRTRQFPTCRLSIRTLSRSRLRLDETGLRKKLENESRFFRARTRRRLREEKSISTKTKFRRFKQQWRKSGKIVNLIKNNCNFLFGAGLNSFASDSDWLNFLVGAKQSWNCQFNCLLHQWGWSKKETHLILELSYLVVIKMHKVKLNQNNF